ncbi:MAG TPA: hypothetical protein VMM92_07370, partial [Thermoanaerobaculia bacterium]|nr:hypothetical protein [Thermoanaerobaculia bacterium]
PFTCSIGYVVSTSGSGALHDTPRDRVCTAEIVYKDSTGSASTTRDYSCVVLANNSSCTATIDPSASSVPTGFSPAAVVTAPLHSSTEEDNGCTYLILDSFATPPTRYPSATISTMPSLQVFVLHYFDCTSVP